MTTFYTSDHHFFHWNINRYCNRGFATVEEMNEKMISVWNSRVTNEDTVHHLGDFCLASLERQQSIFNRLNGIKYLVKGNHDGSITRMKRVGFKDVFKQLVLDDFILSHRPAEDTEANQKRIWVCGHVHTAWKSKTNPNGLIQVNIGVDQWNYLPVTKEEIYEAVGR